MRRMAASSSTTSTRFFVFTSEHAINQSFPVLKTILRYYAIKKHYITITKVLIFHYITIFSDDWGVKVLYCHSLNRNSVVPGGRGSLDIRPHLFPLPW